MATWGIRSLLLLIVLFKNQRGSLRRYAVELLLFGDEVNLRLWHQSLLVHLMLLLRSEPTGDGWSLSRRGELERIRAHWRHKAKSLVLVADRHGRASTDERRWISWVVHLGCCIVWCVDASRVNRTLTHHLFANHHLLQAIILRISPLPSLTFDHHLLLEF